MVVLAAVAVATALGAFRSGSPAAAGSRTDAIKLHGAWTLQIRERGRTIRTVRFHNDLSNPAALVKYLSRQISVGQWSVGIANQVCGTPASPEFCWDDEGGGGGVAQTHNVALTTPSSGPDAGKLVLKASIPMGVDGSITGVNTALRQCDASSAPSKTCGGGDFALTHRDLATPVPVVAGQQVLITVRISFS
jgi:hypothetical protein